MNAYESFRNPDNMYRGTDFWMLNDRLDDQEIERQMTEMKKQGVYSFIARTYIGLKSDYPGPDFKARLKTMVRLANKLDMRIFLQAGYMPEHVLDLPEVYSLNYLKVYKAGDEIPADEAVLCEHNGVIITDYNSKTFLDMFNQDSVAFYLKQSYENMWTEFEDEYGKAIMSIWVDEPSYSGEYNPYPRGFAEKFQERWGYDLRPVVYQLFFDEGNYKTVRYHYRKLLQDMLENAYFRMLREWCNSHGIMASGHLMMEDTLESQITRAAAIMPYYRYFDIPGVDLLCGQMNWRDNPILPDGARPFSFRPMINNTPIQCASVARQIGSEHILCEMYGVTSHDMTFRNQKYHFDYLAAHGVNHRSVHGIFYSLHGRGKRAYPPHTNYFQPYWNDLHQIYDYVASTSRFISLGKPDGRTLVLHPLDSAYCEYTNRACAATTGVQASREDLHRRDIAFHQLIMQLTLSNAVFDLGDERSIELSASVEDNLFVLGQMKYSTVVLPNLLTIQKTTLDQLRAFAQAGGKVIVLGSAPTMLDGVPTNEALLDGIATATAATTDALLPLLPAHDYCFDCEFDNRSVFIRRRTTETEGYYFLFNADCSSKKPGVFTIHDTVRAEIWDGFSKERTPVPCTYQNGDTILALTIPEGGSIMLYTEKLAAPANTVMALPTATAVYPLSSNWQVERRQKNVLLLEFCNFKRGDDAYSRDYPVLAVHEMLVAEDYHGPLTQKFTFTAEQPFDGLELVLEDAADHTIVFNGQPIPTTVTGYYWSRSFHTVALPTCAAGENVIEVTRNYVPLEKMKSSIGSLFQTQNGVELESMYLIGNFAVKTVQEPERNGNLRYARAMTLVPETGSVFGELTRNGYPFYAGTIALTQEFNSTFGGDGKLVLDELNGSHCHVYLNGVDCGTLRCAPYCVDISHALKEGKNVLTLELVNTLRNLLGPYHRPLGELGTNFGGGYKYPNAAWAGGTPGWYDNRVPDTADWTESYLLTKLGVKGVHIVREL